MDNSILRVKSLTKTYQNKDALHNVSLSLKPGKIYGLIGRNGAGKSTLMRVIAGYTYQTRGSIELFGKTGEKNLKEERKRIGCMIEYPSFRGNLTAEENIRFHRVMRGIPNRLLEQEALELVGLSDADKKKARNFSLGMKQRLGIANVLIGNPEFLILDEPINGLDPIGVMEVRNLLVKLCLERQMTILIASHNLPELYQVATDYIIINNGEILKSITSEQLDEQCKHHISIKCSNVEKLVGLMEENFKTKNYVVMPDDSLKLYDFLDDMEYVSKMLYDNGIYPTEFYNAGDTLENFFLSTIGGA